MYIEGRLRTEEWTDRDGNKRHSLEVNATDMQFIGTRGDDSHHPPAPSRGDDDASAGSPDMTADDDIPF